MLFLIVPMLNPDGVIVGNYRCSLAAADLNRRWAKPSARLHPTVHALKRLLLRLQTRQSIAIYVDLHGHSRKQHVFMYGCADMPRGDKRAVPTAANCLLQQVFPLLMSRADPEGFFQFRSCNYTVPRGRPGQRHPRRGVARAVHCMGRVWVGPVALWRATSAGRRGQARAERGTRDRRGRR